LPGLTAREQTPAQLQGLPGLRQLAFVFDPTSFAQAILAFTAAHND
jgi:hypothetical protein